MCIILKTILNGQWKTSIGRLLQLTCSVFCRSIAYHIVVAYDNRFSKYDILIIYLFVYLYRAKAPSD
ncbi:hypothetical protein BpHYR1_024993 [Brachionus plicatilis]|uniref:Uncharacterized protein n=1 Tax=Brachionus plicatilis TaxID=10195 RepID=A0A3M7RVD3_BRAPC|nr:hypothetical protein BpHYR1_024993 [Brachionus plicatilis]